MSLLEIGSVLEIVYFKESPDLPCSSGMVEKGETADGTGRESSQESLRSGVFQGEGEMMKRWRAVGVCLAVMALASVASVAMAQRTIVVGTAYGTYEIVSDSGDVYEVVADEKGGELAGLDGMRVSVSGLLDVSGGRMILQVISYAVLEDQLLDRDEMIGQEPFEPMAEDDYPPEEEPFPGEEPYFEEEPLTEREYLDGEPPEDMLPE